jgi:hypothetical protein
MFNLNALFLINPSLTILRLHYTTTFHLVHPASQSGCPKYVPPLLDGAVLGHPQYPPGTMVQYTPQASRSASAHGPVHVPAEAETQVEQCVESYPCWMQHPLTWPSPYAWPPSRTVCNGQARDSNSLWYSRRGRIDRSVDNDQPRGKGRSLGIQ